MGPNKKEQSSKALNKNHAQNNQDQDAPHQVQEIDAKGDDEYLPASEDEKPSNKNDQSSGREELKKTLELDDDVLEDREDDQVN